MKSRLLHIIILLLVSPHLTCGQTSSSVLSEGTWYKLAILEDGIYKIDASLLDDMGFDRKNMDVENIALFGNSYNGMLPQLNSTDRPDDLIENSIFTFGLDDGSFDRSDYILFFGKSSNHLIYNPSTAHFFHEKNLYSDTSFYYLTIKNELGLRLGSQAAGNTSGSTKDTYRRFSPHEEDLENIISSGRNWFGEQFNNVTSNRSFSFDATGLVEQNPVQLYVRVASEASISSSFSFELNGTSLGSVDMDPVSDAQYVTQADIKEDTFSLNLSNVSELELKINFEISEGVTSSRVGYLDYANLISRHTLDLDHGALIFYSESHGVLEIQGSHDDTQVWDLSDSRHPIHQQFSTQEENLIRFNSTHAGQRFIAFNEDQVETPILIGSVSNQNLHNLNIAEVIYITHPSFLTEAERLATFRSQHDEIRTAVVTTEQIYNEFSSGRQDVTAIRDFLKHQFDQYGTLQYVTLLGDCSYDYKDRIRVSTNIIPVYQSRNSLHPLLSYSSEDYYGFMEEEEGEWIENQSGDHLLNLGIGRVPVKTEEELRDYVDKVIRYETSTFGFGNWRNKVVFVADDGDSNIHQRDATTISDLIDTMRSELNLRKVFLDRYEQVGVIKVNQRSPEASAAFLEAMSNGSLIVNYVGHGNDETLTDERIFTEDLIDQLSNRHLLPFFITATCNFGNYDNPLKVSGGERVLLSSSGGAIAMITSTRAVVSNTNYDLNLALYNSLVKGENGKYPRLGDMIRDTKNNSLSGASNRNYALLGDASMRLAFPDETVELTHINGKELGQEDTLRALGKYTISGQVLSDNELNPNFNGNVVITAFGKPREFKTLGDEYIAQSYTEKDVILFQGEASVSSGLFETEIIIPKNINYSIGYGKISLYAMNESKTLDANGVYEQVVIGGSVNNLQIDSVTPELNLYLGDTEFQNGSTVGTHTTLLAHLRDENGINTSSLGFNNDIVMYLDDSAGINLNHYYTAASGTYEEGWVSYPLYNLSEGEHTITLVAYDTHNNKVERNINFKVSSKTEIRIENLQNYPNPVYDHTTFRFTQDRLGEALDISMILTNLQGKVILEKNYSIDDAPLEVDGIEWDVMDSNRNKVKKGIYIYRLFIQSKVDGATTQAYSRLLILE